MGRIGNTNCFIILIMTWGKNEKKDIVKVRKQKISIIWTENNTVNPQIDTKLGNRKLYVGNHKHQLWVGDGRGCGESQMKGKLVNGFVCI